MIRLLVLERSWKSQDLSLRRVLFRNGSFTLEIPADQGGLCWKHTSTNCTFPYGHPTIEENRYSSLLPTISLLHSPHTNLLGKCCSQMALSAFLPSLSAPNGRNPIAEETRNTFSRSVISYTRGALDRIYGTFSYGQYL